MKNKINIDNLINEEISDFLNESISMAHENFKFSQEFNNSTFQNYEGFSNDYDLNIEKSNVKINWHIVFWLNDYGVENFIVVGDTVEGTYTLNYNNKQTDAVDQTNDKDISEIEWKFVVNEATLSLNGGLYVNSLNFDFKDNTCTISF